MGRMDRPMQMVAIMQEFGWTYDEYMRTPNYVIELIIEKMTKDRKEQELALKRAHRG
jgi:hypothetical protein